MKINKNQKDFYKKFVVEFKNGMWFITNEQFVFKHKNINTILEQINSIIKFIYRSYGNFTCNTQKKLNEGEKNV